VCPTSAEPWLPPVAAQCDANCCPAIERSEGVVASCALPLREVRKVSQVPPGDAAHVVHTPLQLETSTLACLLPLFSLESGHADHCCSFPTFPALATKLELQLQQTAEPNFRSFFISVAATTGVQRTSVHAVSEQQTKSSCHITVLLLGCCSLKFSRKVS